MNKFTFTFLFLTVSLSAQKKIGFKSEDAMRPAGNYIGEIVVRNDTVYMSSGGKLHISTDGANSWKIFSQKDGLNSGGVSAIGIRHSNVYVSTIASGPSGAQGSGKGISFSKDFGVTWSRISQPQDTSTIRGPVVRSNETFFLLRDVVLRNTPFLLDSIYAVAIKTDADNITYDISTTDSSIWIASFAGGLRTASIKPDGTVGYFTLAPLPPDFLSETLPTVDYQFFIDPIEQLNHRVFSVTMARDGIWAGTASGINHSTDGGLSWKHYTYENSGISGNFVVALAEQIYTESNVTTRIIWAATNRATSAAEQSGISYTLDSGATWQKALIGTFVNNIAFDGKIVYAATEHGVYRSSNLGQTWENFLTLTDKLTNDKNFITEFTTIGVVNRPAGKRLLFGGADGLATSDDDGLSWTIHRAYSEPGKNGEEKSYAYPNPFSPKYGIVRFQFDQTGISPSDKVTIKVFDFAMNIVAVVAKGEPVTNVISWDGLNAQGKRVANGGYIYTIEAGKKKFWGKFTVRN